MPNEFFFGMGRRLLGSHDKTLLKPMPDRWASPPGLTVRRDAQESAGQDAVTAPDGLSDISSTSGRPRSRGGVGTIRSEITACLERRDVPQALKLTQQFMCSPADLERHSQWMQDEFARNGSLGDLIEHFWAQRQTILVDMFAIGLFMRFCEAANRYDEFRSPLFAWLRTNAEPTHVWPERAHLKAFKRLTSQQRKDFCRIKYGELPLWNSQDFLTAVEAIAENVEVSPLISNYLYNFRMDRQISYSSWLRGLRASQALMHVLADFVSTPAIDRPPDGWLPDLSAVAEECRDIFAAMDISRGLMLATFHGGLTEFATDSFGRSTPDGVVMSKGGKKGSNPNGIAVGAKGRQTAGFRAFKVLREGRILVIAADGVGGQTSEVDVLGVPLEVADGAPLLAFEANCPTGFYTVVRDGNRFVPMFEPGPAAASGEAFGEFKERWWTFYAAQLERILSGNPCSIAFPRHWIGQLRKLQGDRLNRTDCPHPAPD